MTFGTLLELYDNWNGVTKVNDDKLEVITKDRTLDIYEKRKDLLDRTVVPLVSTTTFSPSVWQTERKNT